jgi:hypothetical protein
MSHNAPLVGGHRRGQPLVVLCGVFLLWLGGRGALREVPQFVEATVERLSAPARPHHRPGLVPLIRLPVVRLPVVMPRLSRHNLRLPELVLPADWAAAVNNPASAAPMANAEKSAPSAPVAAAAHQMLWMAAMANLPLPDGLVGKGAEDQALVVRARGKPHIWRYTLVAAPKAGLAAVGAVLGDTRRWSGDGWMLARRGGDTANGASGGTMGPSYGANQIGAVLRYRLVASEPHKLNAFVRGYGAMNGTGEKEAALGLSARPIAGLPVLAMGEMRVSHFMSGANHVRPAATLVSEWPPLALGHGLEADSYVQAGYVGGAGATPFIDGQMRVERVVEKLGRANVRIGLGAWGGAQENVSRLDIGPTARLSWSEGRVGARLALDWRMRVEGNAAPTSGPALTLSAGF